MENKENTLEEPAIDYNEPYAKGTIQEIFVLDKEKYMRPGICDFEDINESTSVPDIKVSMEEVFMEKHLYL